MRNTYFIAGLALGSYLLSGIAFAADSATETYDVEATVGQTAQITNIVSSLDNGMTFDVGTNTFTASAASFDSADATITDGANITSRIKFDVMVNYAHNVSVKSTNDGMVVDAGSKIAVVAGSAPFLEVLDYSVDVDSDNVSLSFDTDSLAQAGRTQTTAVAGAAREEYTVKVSVKNTPDAVPIVAGTYKDTLTLKIGAAF